MRQASHLFAVGDDANKTLDGHGAPVSRAYELHKVLQADSAACCGTGDELDKLHDLNVDRRVWRRATRIAPIDATRVDPRARRRCPDCVGWSKIV